MSQPFKPTPTDIQNLQSIRRAINRTAYHGGLGLRESGKMLGTMDRLLKSFGIGPDDHGVLEPDDPLNDLPKPGPRPLYLDCDEVSAKAHRQPTAHEGDNCRCPNPMTCLYCSRMYPCDCAGCPASPTREIPAVDVARMCKTCHAKPVVVFEDKVYDECQECYSKGYGK
jgi:hypothetical protein